MTKARLSKVQEEVIQHLRATPGALLVRYSGGFWSLPKAEMRPSFGTAVPMWYVGTGTVISLTKLGILKRTNQHEDPTTDPRELAIA